jgi:hypothetical protein
MFCLEYGGSIRQYWSAWYHSPNIPQYESSLLQEPNVKYSISTIKYEDKNKEKSGISSSTVMSENQIPYLPKHETHFLPPNYT